MGFRWQDSDLSHCLARRESPPSGALDLGPCKYYCCWTPFDMDSDGFPDIVAGYVTRPYGGDRGADYGTTFFLNDSTGAFRVVDWLEILPSHESGSKRLELGIFASY